MYSVQQRLHIQLIILFIFLFKCSGRHHHKKDEDLADICGSKASAVGFITAAHKSCLLRPDTGPCRADILRWYYDAKMSKCYRYFWGGCQGNGNKFVTKKECLTYCHLNRTVRTHLPYFCSLPFDYGSCFGHYTRWFWDRDFKVCKRRIYSGCGGNQNNFITMSECMATCSRPPANEMGGYKNATTCYPDKHTSTTKKPRKWT